jgi:putative ABC transport system permease protein
MSGFTAAATNGLRELWANRMRSLLSMSGIILGVAALATMLATAEGMLGGFRRFVAARGGIERIAIVGAELPGDQAHLAELSEGLTLRDATAVANAVPLAAHISPELNVGGARVVREGRETDGQLVGCTPDFTAVNRRHVAEGRFITDLDLHTRANVCVIGRSVADAMFPAGVSPVGATVRINGMNSTVVGVLDKFSTGPGDDRPGSFAHSQNLTVCIPLRTAMTRFTGDSRITGLYVRVGDKEYVREVGEQLDNLLLRTHRGVRDFRVETNEATLDDFRKTERSFVLSLGAVAVVALIVGGAGIMNVMLASINERTREIGVRLAIGARSSDIFTQFLMESAVVGAFGGVLGIGGAFALLTALGSAISAALPDSVPVRLTETVMLTGVGFSCTIGLIAGVYPALRASRLNPIEALRSE